MLAGVSTLVGEPRSAWGKSGVTWRTLRVRLDVRVRLVHRTKLGELLQEWRHGHGGANMSAN